MSKRDWLFFTITTVCLMLLLRLCTGCTTTKDVSKGSTTIESSTEKDDSIRTLISERDRFIELYNELMYAGVIFDTSIVHDTVTNTVTITKEGEVKATGNIKSAYVSKSVFNSIMVAKDRTIDSLRKAKEKVNVVTKTEYKDKVVKRTIFPWWFILIAGVVGVGAYLIIKKFKSYELEKSISRRERG